MHVSGNSEARLLADVEWLVARSAELIGRQAAHKSEPPPGRDGTPHPFTRLPGVLLAVIEIDGRFRYVNRAFRSVLCLEGTSLKPYRFYDFLHPDDRAATISAFNRLGVGAEGLYLENRYRGGDDRYRWMGWSGVADFKTRLIHLVAHDLTAYKEAEEALRRSEESLRAAQEVTNMGSFDLDLETGRVVWSEQLVRMLGLEREVDPFEGRFETLLECIHPDDRPAIQALTIRALQTGDLASTTCRIVRRDGVERLLLGRGTTRPDASGRPARMVWTVQDVTERVQAERALQIREAQLRLFIEHAPAAVAMFDTDLRYLAASRRWLQNNRLAGRDLIGLCHYDIYPDMPAHWRETHRRCLQGAVERCEEEWVVRGDGSADWLRWEVRPWYETENVVGGLIMFSEVITEQKQARETIERKRAELEAIVLGLPDAVIFTDPTHRIVMINPAFLRIFGYHPEETDGQTTAHLYVDAGGMGSRIPAGRPAREEAQPYEIWYRRKNGETFLGETVRLQVRDTEGRELGTMSIIRDVTQRKEAESRIKQAHAELLRTHKQLDAIINCTTDLIAAIDPDLRYMAFNIAYQEEFEIIFGRRIERHMSMLDALAHLPEERARAVAGWRRALQGEAFALTEEFGDPRRIRKTYETTYNAIRDEQDRIIGACLVARDVTERIRVERMKNEFISVVNHELRTPLTSITGSLALVMGGISGPLSSETEKMIGVAHRNSERLVRLINDMLDLQKIEAGGLRLRMENLDVGLFVGQALETNRSYADQFGVRIAYREPADRIWVRADADRLHQVIANLLSNAVKFSPAGGTVEVGAARSEAGRCRVYVKDEGPGIPDAFRPHIFKRFSQADSSTHRTREGTGLGLSICKSIIELHGGAIGFETEVGPGTTFYFELPEQVDLDDPSPPPVAPPTRAHILRNVLTEAGYMVTPPADE